jgi:hypothetical protein
MENETRRRYRIHDLALQRMLAGVTTSPGENLLDEVRSGKPIKICHAYDGVRIKATIQIISDFKPQIGEDGKRQGDGYPWNAYEVVEEEVK